MTRPDSRLSRLEYFITILIFVNAMTLALQTYGAELDLWQKASGWPIKSLLEQFDWLVLIIFTVEIVTRAVGMGRRFADDPWNIFDAAVIFVSLAVQTPFFSALRVLRILRVLRLLARLRSLRLVSAVIWKSVTGCVSISLLMLLVLYVFAIIGCEIYGTTNPEMFGNLHLAMYTLFRVAALMAYDDVVTKLIGAHPYASFYLILYFFVTSYVVINFFFAIVVFYLEMVSFDELKTGQKQESAAESGDTVRDSSIAVLRDEVRGLRQQIEALKSRPL